MRIFLLILGGIPALTGAWWIWAHWRLRRLGAGRGWHALVAAFAAAMLAGYAWVVLRRMEVAEAAVPPVVYAVVLLWALLVLPLVAAPMAVGWTVWLAGARLWRALRRGGAAPGNPAPARPGPAGVRPGRREFLGAAAVAFPAVLTLGSTGWTMPQQRRFRVREIAVPVPGLPAVLDGVRIAHVSDTHVGKFTRGPVLPALADAVNRLEADLVLMTGDLIDQTVEDLPEALRMIERIDRRSGLFTIEGNHDLFDGVEAFVRGVRESGVPLLRDERAVARVRGYPVQVLGLRWHLFGSTIESHVEAVAERRDPEAFSILLAHHPHAFDRAAELGVPLTLAGHTHGGQLMLAPGLGAGPMMFKYWSGLYRKEEASLVVSNGAGNWFPLRTGAPAELLHLILRAV